MPHGTRQCDDFWPFWIDGQYSDWDLSSPVSVTSKAEQPERIMSAVCWLQVLNDWPLIEICKKGFEDNKQKYSYTGMEFHIQPEQRLQVLFFLYSLTRTHTNSAWMHFPSSFIFSICSFFNINSCWFIILFVQSFHWEEHLSWLGVVWLRCNKRGGGYLNWQF